MSHFCEKCSNELLAASGECPNCDYVSSRSPGCSTAENCGDGAGLNLNKGVWFKSCVTGMLYANHGAAGDIEAVCIDGIWYDKNR